MTLPSMLRLLVLSMIWGSSYIFFKIAVLEIPAPLLAWLRAVFGALFLGGLLFVFGTQTKIKSQWKVIALVAVFASALPFVLFAYASKTVTASMLVILNATSPIWAAVFNTLWKRRLPKALAMLGLLVGLLGVAFIVGHNISEIQVEGIALGILAGLMGSASYGVASNIALGIGKGLDPMTNALGCLVLGTVLLAPLAPFNLPAAMPGLPAIASTIAVGVLCSGLAYMIYFKLVRDIGPISALTVTFLTPVFGILWSHLFLGEAITWHTLAGGITVVAGTVLVASNSSPSD